MAKFSISDLLGEQSKSNIEEGFKIKNIPLDDIVPSPKNNYGIRDIEELANNIELVGLMHNIVVKKLDDKYEIISGERRYRAYSKLREEDPDKYSTIPCKVEEESLSELKLLFANSQARELTDYEKTYQASRIKELLLELKEQGYKFPGRMREQIADLLKVSPAQVGRMESINKNLSEPLKEKFKKDEINITTAYESSRLDEEKQEEVLKKVEEGPVTAQDVKNIVESAIDQIADVEIIVICGEEKFECHNRFQASTIVRNLLKGEFKKITIEEV